MAKNKILRVDPPNFMAELSVLADGLAEEPVPVGEPEANERDEEEPVLLGFRLSALA